MQTNQSLSSADQEATLGSTVRHARETAGLSVRQLAALVGTNHSNISRIENGDIARPPAELLQDIAEVLELDASELLTFIGVKTSLPEPKVYFRKAYGFSDDEAEEAAAIVAELQAKRRRPSSD